jgi:SRSO17 transposase
MTSAWAQRQADLWRSCLVSPHVFAAMVDRLGACVVPYQHALETEAGTRHVPLSLAGLLAHWGRKKAEQIAAWVDVERLVLQEFMGPAPWDHRPLLKGLVGQVVAQLGEPDGVLAFDPSSCPQRGTHAVGVKRQWCGHRGTVDHCQVGVFMGSGSRHAPALLDFRWSLPEEWARDEHRCQACHGPEAVAYHTRHEQGLALRDLGSAQVPHGWGTGAEEWGRHTRGRQAWQERGER